MEKRLYPIVLLTVLLALLAAAGYILPPSGGATPMRVLLDNKGGKIVFEHKAHAEGYGLERSSCHHAENLDQGSSPCGECHNAETAEFGLLKQNGVHSIKAARAAMRKSGSGPPGKETITQPMPSEVRHP